MTGKWKKLHRQLLIDHMTPKLRKAENRIKDLLIANNEAVERRRIAAMEFVIDENSIIKPRVQSRAAKKVKLFREWHRDTLNKRDNLQEKPA